jgi:hypothetical protein
MMSIFIKNFEPNLSLTGVHHTYFVATDQMIYTYSDVRQRKALLQQILNSICECEP